MNRNQLSLSALLLSALFLASCSGIPKTSGGGGGGGGSTKPLTVTLIGGPESVQTNFTLLAFSAQISSLTLNEVSGTAHSLALSPTPYPVDFNRLTTDSVVLTLDTIPANTSFSNMTMAVQNITVTIANGPAAIGSCAANAVCEFSPAPSNATITATLFPSALTPASDGNVNIYLDVQAQAIVTNSGSAISVNFTSASSNTIGSFDLPRKSSSLGTAVDLVQDFTGVVTAVSATSITVTNGSGVSVTAGLGTGTTLDVPQTALCPTNTVAACATKGSIVSMDAAVFSGGALAALEIDLLDTSTAVDSVEGTVVSLLPASFSLVVTDKQVTSGDATLTAANIGDIFSVTLDPAATFLVDTKTLTSGATPPVPTSLFASSANILSGQTVRLHVKPGSASGTKGTNNQVLTASQVQLRFTRITGSVAASQTNIINLSSGSTNQVYQLGTTAQIQVQTYPGVTTYDNGITSNSDIGGTGSSNLVSIRALYLKSTPNFFATTVRDQ